MDKLDNNKGTPTKRTGIKSKEMDTDTKVTEIYSREIEQPSRSDATPDIPVELPPLE